MSGRGIGTSFAVLAATISWALVLAAPGYGASGTWDRAWGRDVVNGGGSGFEICSSAPVCQSGLPGTLGGEFQGPNGLATDSAGNVYVADENGRRIEKFDSSGNFLRAWGKDVDAVAAGTGFEICTVAANCKNGEIGALGGEFSLPVGIAVDPAGSVYVVDLGNKRIDKFDSSGNFQRAWGKDVDSGGGTGFEICSTPATCQAGSAGGLGGEFNQPQAVATDSASNVYVVDSGNQRIQKFDSAGNFQRAWGKDVDSGGGTGFEICSSAFSCKVGVTGTLGGEFNGPIGIATDQAGSVYVAEYVNQRIQKFDSAGNFQRAWGKDVDSGGGTGFEICTNAVSCKIGISGVLGGEFNTAAGIAADAQGHVYVSETLNNQRIQRFDSSGNFQRAWGKDVVAGGAAVFETCTVAASCGGGATGGLAGELNGAFGLATDSAGNLYVADFTNQRVQKFADPVPPPSGGGGGSATPAGPTGQRAAALKKCKKKHSAKARKRCRKKANLLPV